MSDDMGRLLAAMERLEDGQGRLQAEQSSLRSDLSGMRSDLTGMRSDLMDRVDRLQDAINGIRDDIAVKYGTAEQVQRANDNTRSELRALHEVVNGMMRQVQRLQSEVRILKGDI